MVARRLSTRVQSIAVRLRTIDLTFSSFLLNADHGELFVLSKAFPKPVIKTTSFNIRDCFRLRPMQGIGIKRAGFERVGFEMAQCKKPPS